MRSGHELRDRELEGRGLCVLEVPAPDHAHRHLGVGREAAFEAREQEGAAEHQRHDALRVRRLVSVAASAPSSVAAAIGGRRQRVLHADGGDLLPGGAVPELDAGVRRAREELLPLGPHNHVLDGSVVAARLPDGLDEVRVAARPAARRLLELALAAVHEAPAHLVAQGRAASEAPAAAAVATASSAIAAPATAPAEASSPVVVAHAGCD